MIDRQKIELSINNEKARREDVLERLWKVRNEYISTRTRMERELARLSAEIDELEESLMSADKFIQQNTILLEETID